MTEILQKWIKITDRSTVNIKVNTILVINIMIYQNKRRPAQFFPLKILLPIRVILQQVSKLTK